MTAHIDAARRARAAWLSDGQFDAPDDPEFNDLLRDVYIAGYVAGYVTSNYCPKPCCVGGQESLAQPMPTTEVPSYSTDSVPWTMQGKGAE